jgi:GTP-binding protein EngB required for normal cell division
MLVEAYLLRRESLDLVLQLVDFRHGLLDNDRIFQQWARGNDIPVQVVFTKADKIARESTGSTWSATFPGVFLRGRCRTLPVQSQDWRGRIETVPHGFFEPKRFRSSR